MLNYDLQNDQRVARGGRSYQYRCWPPLPSSWRLTVSYYIELSLRYLLLNISFSPFCYSIVSILGTSFVSVHLLLLALAQGIGHVVQVSFSQTLKRWSGWLTNACQSPGATTARVGGREKGKESPIWGTPCGFDPTEIEINGSSLPLQPHDHWMCRYKRKSTVVKFFSFPFWGTADEIQGLAHPKQVLYHITTSTALSKFYFEIGSR